MNLIIDKGNTRTKFHLFRKDTFLETHVFFNKNKKETNDCFSKLDYKKIILSTTSEIPEYLQKMDYLELDSETKIPINLNYKTPKTLGSDRIALSVGANHLFPKNNCIIIGTGTCITIDMVSKNAEYLGGAISPGLTMRLQSLHTFTKGLPLIELKKEKKSFPLIGKSTEESMESGVFNGAFSEIDGVINRYKKNYKDLTVILTGGDHEIFANNLKNSFFAHSNLQAIGLNRILEYNA